MYNKNDVNEVLDEAITDAWMRGDTDTMKKLEEVQETIGDNKVYIALFGLVIGFGMIWGLIEYVAESVVSGVRVLIDMLRKH